MPRRFPIGALAGMVPKWRTSRRFAAIVVTAVATACSGSDRADTPIAPGSYAVNGGHYVRLDGPTQWEEATWDDRVDLDDDLALLLVDPSLDRAQPTPPAGTIKLAKVAFLRDEVSTATGARTQPSERRWVSTNRGEFELPLDLTWATDGTGGVLALPRLPLEPGLYAVRMTTASGALHGRFGVDWDDVDKDEYALRICVDHYVDGALGVFERCDAATAFADGELAIAELEPVRRAVGETQVLVVDGEVINRSEHSLLVPRLQATVRGEAASDVQTWTFAAQSTYLLPGAATTFRTELRHPPDGLTDVHVEFVGTP